MADLSIAIAILGEDKFSPVAKGITGSIGGIFDAAGKLGMGVFGITQLAQGIGSVASGMISGNAQMETYQSQLETLMGSADGAKERIAQLAQIGADTPFELPQLVQSEKILMGFGLTTDKTMKLTGKSLDQFRTSLGDMAAGTGTDLGELTNLWGKFGSGATGEAISRLQELGIVTREQLTEVGVQFSKSGELVSPLPEAMAAAVKIADSKFGGGMAKLSQTFEGQMSTLSDSFNQAKVAIMAPIFDVLKGSLTSVNAFLAGGTFKDALSGIASLMAGGVKSGIEGLVAGFNNLTDAFAMLLGLDPGEFANSFDELGGIFTRLQVLAQPLVDAFTTVQQVFAGDWGASDSINPVVNAIGTLATIVRDNGPLIISVVEGIAAGFAAFAVISSAVALVASISAGFAGMTAAAAAAGGVLPVVLAAIGGPVTLLAVGVGLLAAAWINDWGGIQEKTAAVWAVLQPIFQGILTEVGRFTTEMLPLATAAWTNLSAIVGSIATALWALIQTGVAALVTFWQANHETITQVVSVAWGLIKGYVQVGWDLVSGIIKTGLQVLSGDWSGAWATIQETVNNVWTHIQEAIGPAWALISGAITKALAGILDGISKWATDSLNTVSASMATVGQGMLDGIKAGILAGWAGFTGWLAGKITQFNPFSGAGGTGGTFAGGIQGVVPGGSGQTTSAGTHGGHPAIDIFALKGTPIRAPVGGISTPAYYSLGGNATIIAGDDGRFYYFAHGNVPFVPGRVSAGQQIGQVGDTGNAQGTSPHLHAAVASSAELFNLFNGSGDFDPVEVFNRVAAAAGGMGDVVDAATAKLAAGVATITTAGTGLAQSLAQGISQGDAVVADAVETIVQGAIRHGMDPLIALALAKSESEFDPRAKGDQGKSVGLFQLHEAGQGAGMSAAERADPAANTERFLAAHKALYDQLVAEGLAGEELAQKFGLLAEKSDPQYAYRYAEAYREILAQVGNVSTVGAAAAQTTNGLAASQQQATDWARVFAEQQAALSQVLAGQAPPLRASTDAMTALSAVLGPIERQVAGGAISMDTLQFKLVDLARATGLATAPWRDFDAGLIDINEAMMRVVMQSADAGPAFEALRQQLGTTNAITDQGALSWLQLALNYGKATPALAANAAATTTATTATAGLNSATGQVNQTIDPALYGETASRVNDLTKALDGGSSAFGKIGEAAAQASGIIREFLGASQSLGDYLDGHTFDFHVNLPTLPDWAIPGSPMPLETALWGLNRALRATNHISAASLGSLPIPTFAGAPAGPNAGTGQGGGGDTYLFQAGSIVIPGFLGTIQQAGDALESHFTTKKGHNGRLAWER